MENRYPPSTHIVRGRGTLGRQLAAVDRGAKVSARRTRARKRAGWKPYLLRRDIRREFWCAAAAEAWPEYNIQSAPFRIFGNGEQVRVGGCYRSRQSSLAAGRVSLFDSIHHRKNTWKSRSSRRQRRLGRILGKDSGKAQVLLSQNHGVDENALRNRNSTRYPGAVACSRPGDGTQLTSADPERMYVHMTEHEQPPKDIVVLPGIAVRGWRDFQSRASPNSAVGDCERFLCWSPPAVSGWPVKWKRQTALPSGTSVRPCEPSGKAPSKRRRS